MVFVGLLTSDAQEPVPVVFAVHDLRRCAIMTPSPQHGSAILHLHKTQTVARGEPLREHRTHRRPGFGSRADIYVCTGTDCGHGPKAPRCTHQSLALSKLPFLIRFLFSSRSMRWYSASPMFSGPTSSNLALSCCRVPCYGQGCAVPAWVMVGSGNRASWPSISVLPHGCRHFNETGMKETECWRVCEVIERLAALRCGEGGG